MRRLLFQILFLAAWFLFPPEGDFSLSIIGLALGGLLGGGLAGLDIAAKKSRAAVDMREVRNRGILEDQFEQSLINDPLFARLLGNPNVQRTIDPRALMGHATEQINAAAGAQETRAFDTVAALGLDSPQRLFSQQMIDQSRRTQLQAAEQLISELEITQRPQDLASTAASQVGATLGFESARISGKQ